MTTLKNVVKVYPTFARIVQFNSPITVQQKGYEVQKKQTTQNLGITNFEEDSIRRTKTTISDIVLCNDFEYFATFTFATHRQDIDRNKRRMSKWLNKQQELHGKFRYLIVPERHKDGALHFHALLGDYKGKIAVAKTANKNKKIYNIKSYRMGYNTLIKINKTEKDIKKVSNYIRKYITKDMITTKNKQRFWSSQNLLRPVKLQNVSFATDFLASCDNYATKDFVLFETSLSHLLTELQPHLMQQNLEFFGTIKYNDKTIKNKGKIIWTVQT